MKLKALLLGSAAAMMSVAGVSTSAIAADAVIAEPHPVEYVRVCDMYGAKWFYIPGTETCLSLSGYVRVEYDYQDNDNAPSNGNFQYRARIDLRTKNETDYGTLEGWIRLQGGEDGGLGDANVGVDRALISLAGFRLGYSDDYWTTAHGYGGFTDIGDGLYGYGQGTFFDYTYSANGFSATAGVNYRGARAAAAVLDSAGDIVTPAVVGTADTRELDYYVGVGYTASWGGFAGTIIHDNVVDDWAYKISADVNVIEGLSLRGWYGADDDGLTKYVGTGGAFWGVGAKYQFNDMLALNATYTDGDAANVEYITLGLDIRPVPGLIIRPEVQFADTFNEYSVRVYRTF